MGLMSAVFQSMGSFWLLKDFLNKIVSGRAIVLAKIGL